MEIRNWKCDVEDGWMDGQLEKDHMLFDHYATFG
jgi:hypothetical protein